MSSPPPNPESESDGPSQERDLPRALPPPAARKLSSELIDDLHARRRWLAEAPRSSHKVMWDYLRHNWYDREAQTWAAAQVSAAAALAWRELGLTPGEAADLERDGFTPEAVGAQWRRSRIPVHELGDWIGAGLTPEEAVEQRARGITAADAAVMRSLRRTQP